MSTIYRLVDVDGRTLYVGCTEQPLPTRLKQHLATQPWAAEITGILPMASVLSGRLLDAERQYAAGDVPKYGNWNPVVASEMRIAQRRRSRELLNGQKLRNDIFRMNPRQRWYFRAVCDLIADLVA